MSGVRPRSILLGVVVDKVAFVASALLLATLFGVSSPAFQALVLVFGLAATAAGGFAAAWHARQRFVAHGLAVGAIALAISLGRFVVNALWPPAAVAAGHPIGWELVGWIGAVLAGLAGGRLARTTRRRSPGPAEPETASWAIWLPVFLAIIALLAFAEHP